MEKDLVLDHRRGELQRVMRMYGIDSWSLVSFCQAENEVYCVKDNSNALTIAIKFHRLGYRSDSELLSEHMFLNELRMRKYGNFVVRQNLYGSTLTRLATTLGLQYVSASDWIPGESLASVLAKSGWRDLLDWWSQLGRELSKFHTICKSYRAPANFVRPRLDLQGLLGPRAIWGLPANNDHLRPDERRWITKVTAKLGRVLDSNSESLGPLQLIHADAHPSNAICCPQDRRISLLDFDDLSYGYALYDLACSAWASLVSGYFLEATSSLEAGYIEVRNIPKNSRHLLPLLVVVRGLTYLGWMSGRRGRHDVVEVLGYLEKGCKLIGFDKL